MIPGVMGVWLPSALLLLQVPSCVPLLGPSKVTGTVGESLSVKCQYKEEHKNNKKYWCRVSLLPPCKEIVKTRASKEAGNGRVSIRDHPATLTFTVTLENLTLEDAGTYKCVVDIPLFDDYLRDIDPSLGIDEFFKVVVSVVPGRLASSLEVSTSPSAPWEGPGREALTRTWWGHQTCRLSHSGPLSLGTRVQQSCRGFSGEDMEWRTLGQSVFPSLAPVTGSSPENRAHTLGSPTSSSVHTQPSVTTEDTTPGPSLRPRPVLSSIYFKVLVFLEVPLLLIMLSAVLWVNRPQRCSGKKQHCPDYENQ